MALNLIPAAKARACLSLCTFPVQINLPLIILSKAQLSSICHIENQSFYSSDHFKEKSDAYLKNKIIILLDSLYKGFPIGAMLVWTPESEMATVPVEFQHD